MPVNQPELKKFWDDGTMKQAVEEYLAMHLDAMALTRVYRKEDTAGIADAKEIIDNAFAELDDLFGKEKVKGDPTNEAR